MALTISITPSAGGSTISYAESAGTPGRYARSFDPGGSIADLKKFRPTGTDGSLIVRGGQIGRKIAMTVRYIGATIDDAMSAFRADEIVYSNAAMDIVCLGITYSGCNLVPGSMRQAMPFMPTGTDAETFFDVAMMFTEDQP